MIIIEIEENQNCESVDMRIFNNSDRPQRVSHLRLEKEMKSAQWYEVVGWTRMNSPTEAVVQKVDDSGDGTALLVHGGDCGLRLREEVNVDEWNLNNAKQWGLPFYLTTDSEDIRYKN